MPLDLFSLNYATDSARLGLSWLERWQTLIGSAIGSAIVVLATILLSWWSGRRERLDAARGILFGLYTYRAELLAYREQALEASTMREGASAGVIGVLASTLSSKLMEGLIFARYHPDLPPTFDQLVTKIIPSDQEVAGWLSTFRALDRMIRRSVREIEDPARRFWNSEEPPLSDGETRRLEALSDHISGLLDLSKRSIDTLEMLFVARGGSVKRILRRYKWGRQLVKKLGKK